MVISLVAASQTNCRHSTLSLVASNWQLDLPSLYSAIEVGEIRARLDSHSYRLTICIT